jgi:hypothetical protein
LKPVIAGSIRKKLTVLMAQAVIAAFVALGVAGCGGTHHESLVERDEKGIEREESQPSQFQQEIAHMEAEANVNRKEAEREERELTEQE